MTNKLNITGNIENGWAQINFEFGQEFETLTTSYIFDGLTNLITAVSLLNKGLVEAEVQLIGEPHEHVIRVKKISGENNLLIQVFTFDNYKGKPLSERVDGLVLPDFEMETTLKRLTLQICNLFDQFEQEYGLGGYLERWHHEFPSGKINNLRNNRD